ncbi:hypothetical protein [Thermococcus sp.]|uniref:hypothetical protein n=1 Tax=Thermococcus sp. TaxID=35749 RepID=UPI0034128861
MMDVNELKTKFARFEALHAEFERKFPGLYEETNYESILREVKGLHSLVMEKLDLASTLYRELAGVGGRIEELTKEIQRNEHQMKFRLEEVLSLLSKVTTYDARLKLGTAMDRLSQFHRVYDYAISRSVDVLSREFEELTLLMEGEKEKKVPLSIMDKLGKIDEIEDELGAIKRFMFRLYTHPGDVHRVEEALRDWHSRGLLWVEARNVEKLSGVRNAGEILEGLTLIGVVEKKMRGGEGVYRHRSFSSG